MRPDELPSTPGAGGAPRRWRSTRRCRTLSSNGWEYPPSQTNLNPSNRPVRTRMPGGVARALYQEAATHCHSVKDYVTRDLFENLMMDEEHHINFLETELDLINRIGLELYTQKHVGGLETEQH